MNPGLKLHNRIDLLARNLELNGFKSSGFRRRARKHLNLPTVRFGKTLIHLKEVTRKNCRLITAYTGAYFNDGIFFIIGIPRNELDFNLVFKLGKLSFILSNISLKHLFLFRIT